MELRSIKTTRSGKIAAAWSEVHGEAVESRSLTSEDEPRPELRLALQRLVPALMTACEFEEDYGEGITITGLTVGGQDDDRKVTISAKKVIGGLNAPFNIHSPLVPLYKENGLFSEIEFHAICDVINEGKRYVSGERAQKALPLDAEGKGDSEDDAGKGDE